ncbi:type II CAAX endopeptidase family protein [Aquimarina sp. I32.4]|uniref:type II CAAX endopeptidase family protein n=1 Tax=Aquimarina sp. I32.4 TaxID=2053903 RepID=UPI000CDF093F|nr:type II CAAX endopeptidase family protein [Aquimarina sp. I32.4]
MKYHLPFFFLFYLFICININAQSKKLKHDFFLEKLKHSETKTYNDILDTFDTYLQKHPNDILTHIEKCKFIRIAQYDEYEDSNPNQKYFDSITTALLNKYPNHPDVLVFHTSFTWGDELKKIFEKAEKSIKTTPELWSSENLGIIYYEIAINNYDNDDFENAYTYIKKAISYDKKYTSILQYSKILISLEKKGEALESLQNGIDSTTSVWQLNQRANLILKLEDYPTALSIYKKINAIDSTYNNKAKLAKTLEGIEEYTLAREYLVADTINNWNNDAAQLNLFLHDLKFQNSDDCIDSYNAYRDNGYAMDPLCIYRLKLFFTHPFLSWKIHDILGLSSLLLLFLLFIILPSIWILPVYFIGHKWKIINHSPSTDYTWGLKSFWIVSSGFLLASFASLLVEPEALNSWINWTEYDDESINDQKLGLSTLIFILSAAVFSFITLNKTNIKVFFLKHWSIGKSILTAIGYFILFKIISVIYIRVGMSIFDISIEDLTSIPNILLSTREDILALLSNYGNGTGYLLIGILVPIYEELIFRGVILDSCRKYIFFNWANVLQSLLFATVHGDLFLFPVFFIFGLFVGSLRKKSGSLLPGIIFHSINNILAISIMISKGGL